jgi:Na+-driven multidrug efflux pump
LLHPVIAYLLIHPCGLGYDGTWQNHSHCYLFFFIGFDFTYFIAMLAAPYANTGAAIAASVSSVLLSFGQCVYVYVWRVHKRTNFEWTWKAWDVRVWGGFFKLAIPSLMMMSEW